MVDVEPKDISVQETFRYLLGGVGPRPIAFVSTISKDGINNLAPFSFFNAFGANPPMIGFSPARRGRDGTLKDTYHNLMATKECVVQVVTHAIVEQVNLASTEYEPGIDEFVKAGFTPIDSDLVKPKRVKESPFQMECKLSQMVHLGEKPASGNLALCEVIKFHISENIMEDGVITPDKIDLVGRMGGNFYARASGAATFEVEKPVSKTSIGYDGLPEFIKKSNVFSENDLGQLANFEKMPTEEEVKFWFERQKPLENVTDHLFQEYLEGNDFENMFRAALALRKKGDVDLKHLLFQTAKCALAKGQGGFAWHTVLYAQQSAKSSL